MLSEACLLISCCTSATFQSLSLIEGSGNEGESYGTSAQLKLLSAVTLACGCILGFVFVFRCILMICKERGVDQDWMVQILTPSMQVGEVRLKTAAQRKMMALLRSKVECDREARSDSNRLEDNRARPSAIQDATNEDSLVWTAKQIYSGELFSVEGIWIPTRLLVICGAQVAVFILSIVFASLALTGVSNNLEDARQELPSEIPDWVERCVVLLTLCTKLLSYRSIVCCLRDPT